MFLKQAIHRILEPGGMPEFERTLDFARQCCQKIGQQSFVAFQCGRKLKQHWTQAPGGSQWVDSLKEHVCEFRGLQALNVRDAHVRFEGKNEASARFGYPFFER